MSKSHAQKILERPAHRVQGSNTFQQENITQEFEKSLQQEESVPQDHETEEMTRNKAYELHQQRGYQHGHDMDDWLEAEKIGRSKAL